MMEIGQVISVADGVVRAYGLSHVQVGEWVQITTRTGEHIRGIVENLEVDAVAIIVVGSTQTIGEGDEVQRTQQLVSVPVGMGLLGRVVDALGDPIDGLGPLQNVSMTPVERAAPGIIARQSVCEPLATGVQFIDALIPIGLGQRELIVGDRQTGKTTLAIDSIINQRSFHHESRPGRPPVYCIYVAIGQKRSSVVKLLKTLQDHRALDYTIIVAATASDPAPMQYLAPYAACAMGEYFRDRGMHALVVYDDLSKHAVAYRQLSLLLKRPPGREAYPGDVFYLHSRLLERAAKLSNANGGGSLTALPIVETQEGDVSAYIPTNVISITDGQIFLEGGLFYKGIRPAINVGISVSRVGSSAQTPAMKRVAGRIKLDLAQYWEMLEFAQFSSDLDEHTKQLLRRGDRLVELLKQDPSKPMPLSEQVACLFAGTKGFFDAVPVDEMRVVQQQWLNFLRQRAIELLQSIETTLELTHESEQLLEQLCARFLDERNHPVDTPIVSPSLFTPYVTDGLTQRD